MIVNKVAVITKPYGFVPRLKSGGLSWFGEGKEKSTEFNSNLKTKDFSRALNNQEFPPTTSTVKTYKHYFEKFAM